MVGKGELGEHGAGFGEKIFALLLGEVVWDEEVAIFVEEGQLIWGQALDVGGGGWGRDAGGNHDDAIVVAVMFCWASSVSLRRSTKQRELSLGICEVKRRGVV